MKKIEHLISQSVEQDNAKHNCSTMQAIRAIMSEFDMDGDIIETTESKLRGALVAIAKHKDYFWIGKIADIILAGKQCALSDAKRSEFEMRVKGILNLPLTDEEKKILAVNMVDYLFY